MSGNGSSGSSGHTARSDPEAATGALPWLVHAPVASWERRFLVGLGILLALVELPLLGRVPRAFVDDSWSEAMAAYTLAFEGRPRNPGQMGLGGVDTYLVEPRIFPSVIGAGIYRLAGFGLTQGRLAAVIFGAIFVFAAWGSTRLLFGSVAAATVGVMTAIDPWQLICGRTYRPEIFLATLLWLSWWFLLEAMDRRSATRALLGGACVGLACWTHANAVVFSAAALIGLIVAAGFGILKRAWLPYAVIGMVAGLAPYWAYVLYVQGVSDVRWLDQVGPRTEAYARPVWEILATEKARWAKFLRLPLRLPLAVVLVWAGGWALFRGRRADRLLLTLIVAATLLMPMVQWVATGRYYVALVPALGALVWRSLPRSGVRSAGAGSIGPAFSRAWVNRGIATGMLLVYAGMTLAPTFAIFYAYRRADYDSWVARVAEHIPRDGRVMGHTMYWTGLYDRQFITSIPPYYSDWRTVDNAVTHIEKYQPEYLIQSSTLFGGLRGLGPRKRDLRATVFGRACERVAAQVPARVLTEFYERDFGAVRVWKLEWPAEGASVPTEPR